MPPFDPGQMARSLKRRGLSGHVEVLVATDIATAIMDAALRSDAIRDPDDVRFLSYSGYEVNITWKHEPHLRAGRCSFERHGICFVLPVVVLTSKQDEREDTPKYCEGRACHAGYRSWGQGIGAMMQDYPTCITLCIHNNGSAYCHDFSLLTHQPVLDHRCDAVPRC